MMKRIGCLAVAVVWLGGVCLAAGNPQISSEKDRINYAMGYRIGEDFRDQDVALDADILIRGIRDALSGAPPLMDREERWTALADFRKKLAVTDRKRNARLQAEGRAFLAANAKKEGVVTLPSGLQYEVLAQGSGRTPQPADNVVIRYRGTLPDGTEFADSARRATPASIRVEKAIPGWREALLRMKEGDKWRIFLPPNLAYAGGTPLDGKVVIFELELVSVQPAEQRRAGGAGAK